LCVVLCCEEIAHYVCPSNLDTPCISLNLQNVSHLF